MMYRRIDSALKPAVVGIKGRDHWNFYQRLKIENWIRKVAVMENVTMQIEILSQFIQGARR